MTGTQCGSCQRKFVSEDDPRFKSRCRTCNRLALPKPKVRTSYDNKDMNLRKRYGVTLAQFEFLLDSQENACAICGMELNADLAYKGQSTKPIVDHCHETGDVRGILCNGCNLIIGHAKDSIDRLRRAIVYLQERNSEETER